MSTSTKRMEHKGARLMAAVGLLLSAVYIGWRIVQSLHGTRLWISVPALAVDVVAFVSTSVLVWALWSSEGMTEASRRVRAGLVTPVFVRQSVDVVVRVGDQSAHDVRATLLGLTRVPRIGKVVLLDMHGREWVEQLAREFGVRHMVPDDRNGLKAMCVAVRTPEFLLLEAGDVAAPDIVEALGAEMCDPRVAVVQGRGVPVAADSPEHGARGRHDLEFEHGSLNPGLGRRNVGVWTGTGSLVRTHALQTVLSGARAKAGAMESQWRAGARMLAGGWRIVAPTTPVVTHHLVADDAAVLRDRTDRARAARRLVFGRGGALRSRLSLRARMGVLAWAARPLSGFRRTVFVGVIAAALVSGAMPFYFSAPWLLMVCFPGLLYTSVGLGLLSGWTLHLGDRVRYSLQTLSAAWRSLMPGNLSRTRSQRRGFFVLPSAQYGNGLVLAVVVLSAAIAMRGTNERVFDFIPDMPSTRELMGLMLAALLMLTVSLDLMHVLGSRSSVRRSARLATSLDATLNGAAGRIIDITSLGAGVVGVRGEFHEGDVVVLESQMLTSHGVTAMSTPSVVRNVRWDADGSSRIGVEFVHLDAVVANALVGMCKVEPAWQCMGSRVVGLAKMVEERHTVYVDEEEKPSMGRLLVRAASVMALAGAVATAVPSAVDATPMMAHQVTGVVSVAGRPTVAVPGAVVTVVCSEASGADGKWGTSDDVYDSPVSVTSSVNGAFSVAVHGRACWNDVAPPVGFRKSLNNPSLLSGVYETGQSMHVLNVSASNVDTREELLQNTTPLPTGTASIGSTVWRDLNGDRRMQSSEPGLGGITLTLFDVNGRAVARTVSDYFGHYEFHGLAKGSYFVAASNLTLESVFMNWNTAPDEGSDVNAILGRSGVVHLNDGEANIRVNVGVHTRSVAVAPSVGAIRNSHQLLPLVAAKNLAPLQQRNEPLAVLVVLMVITMFGSLVAAFVMPHRRRVI